MQLAAVVLIAASIFAQAEPPAPAPAAPKPADGADGAPAASGSSRNAPEQMPIRATREDERDNRTKPGDVNPETRADLAGQSTTPTGVMYGTVIGPEMDSGATHPLGGALGAGTGASAAR